MAIKRITCKICGSIYDYEHFLSVKFMCSSCNNLVDFIYTQEDLQADKLSGQYNPKKLGYSRRVKGPDGRPYEPYTHIIKKTKSSSMRAGMPKKANVQLAQGISTVPNVVSERSIIFIRYSDQPANTRIRENFSSFLNNNPELYEDCNNKSNAISFLLRKAFLDNIGADYLVTNLSYVGETGIRVLRFSICTMKCEYVQRCLSDKEAQLQIAGQLSTDGILIIDQINVVGSTILNQNSAIKNIIIRHNPQAAGDGTTLHQFATLIPAYSDTSSDDIRLWMEYLEWKQALARIKVKGIKYCGARIDLEGQHPVVALLAISGSDEEADRFIDVLRRESESIAIYPNSVSQNQWRFDYQNARNTGRTDAGVKWSIDTKPVRRLKEYSDIWHSYYDATMHYNGEDDLDPDACIKRIRGLADAYPSVIFLEIRFLVPEGVSEYLQNESLHDEDIEEYIRKHVLSTIYADGFIATSRIGDFALIDRLKDALQRLQAGQTASKSIGQWLFDVSKARSAISLSDEEIVWSPHIGKKLNESQKLAIRNMLAATDLFLCQGPPGTGKTTVIAEAVYQMTRRNLRVLIASQSNLAVNNALSTILNVVDDPRIRAIRLGSESKLDASVESIAEQNILRTFFGNIRKDVTASYLNRWKICDIQMESLRADLNQASGLTSKICSIQTAMNAIAKELEEVEKKIIETDRIVDASYQKMETSRSRILRNKTFVSFIEQPDYAEYDPYFEIEQQRMILKALRNDLLNLKNVGIDILATMSVDIADLDSFTQRTSNYIIRDCATVVNFILKLPDRLSGSSNMQSSKLLMELRSLERELYEAADSDHEAFKKWKSVKAEIKTLTDSESLCYIPESIERCLAPELSSRITRTDSDILFLHELSLVAQDAAMQLKEHLHSVCLSLVQQEEESLTITLDDPSVHMKESKKRMLHRYEHLQHELQVNEQEINSLCEKYETSTDLFHAVIDEQIKAIMTETNVMVDRTDMENFLQDFVDYIDIVGEDFRQENDEYLKQFINACNVVGVSCTENSNTLLKRGFSSFDVVIIDEVSKATPPELLIPLLMSKKAVFVGDHRQLPPLFCERECTYNEYIEDIDKDDTDTLTLLTQERFKQFEMLVTNSMFKQHYEQADPSIKKALLIQYRMHRDIMDIINLFYNQQLQAGWSLDEEKLYKSHGLTIKSKRGYASLITPDKHAYWIDSSQFHGKHVYEQHPNGTSSMTNPLEAYLIVELLYRIDASMQQQEDGQMVDVGVISFYGAQIGLIRRLLGEHPKLRHIHVEMNTVDQYQGKEKPIVLVSLVRNKELGKRFNAQFVTSYQRINVAFSRAQKLLIIVGAKDMYIDQEVPIENMETGEKGEPHPVYRSIIEILSQKSCFFSSDDFLDESADHYIFRS